MLAILISIKLKQHIIANKIYFKYLKYLSSLVFNDICLIPIFFDTVEINFGSAPKGHSHPQNNALPQKNKDTIVTIPNIKIIGSIKKVNRLPPPIKIDLNKLTKCIILI